jgi:hypothetical protein
MDEPANKTLQATAAGPSVLGCAGDSTLPGFAAAQFPSACLSVIAETAHSPLSARTAALSSSRKFGSAE